MSHNDNESGHSELNAFWVRQHLAFLALLQRMLGGGARWSRVGRSARCSHQQLLPAMTALADVLAGMVADDVRLGELLPRVALNTLESYRSGTCV